LRFSALLLVCGVGKSSTTPAGSDRALSAQEERYVVLVCRFPKPTVLELAEHMNVSPKTVDKFRDKVYKKMGVNCHSDMDHRAVELGLVQCMCQRMKERKG
jgi:DNA-binding CsgD family transcriptional regulator